ncbi:MAG: bile acid:sodium symporter family protein [Myxococcota bacterium]
MNYFTNLFPLWVLFACAIALWEPQAFAWFDGNLIVWGLGLIMLGMGITLSVDDFRRVLTLPTALVAGLAAQFVLMPLAAWTLAETLDLPVPYKVGLLLVACSPGGTASNVVAFIARANVALSVLMTMSSTALAIVLTPVLTSALAGKYVPIDGWQLLFSMLKIVFLPLVLGVVFHHLFPRATERLLPVGPLIAVIVIALICGSILGGSASTVRESGLTLLGVVGLLHSLAFASGYLFARLLGYDELIRRTISIEVGMQNSGLATVLARSHFTDPLTALPGAISAAVHSVIGSALAALWRARSASGNGEESLEIPTAQ